MVIHWKTEDEKVALLEELERLGYEWYGTKRKPPEVCDDKDIGHAIHVYSDNGYKNITHSDKLHAVTHNFSDLIIPELTAEEAVERLCKHYCDVVRRITQWKSNHKKKEPEIEWFWKSYVVGGSDYKEADTEQEAMEWCEYYAKEHPEAKCTYKHVCRVKEMK